MWFLGTPDLAVRCSACLLSDSVRVSPGEQLWVVGKSCGWSIKDDIATLMVLPFYPEK